MVRRICTEQAVAVVARVTLEQAVDGVRQHAHHLVTTRTRFMDEPSITSHLHRSALQDHERQGVQFSASLDDVHPET